MLQAQADWGENVTQWDRGVRSGSPALRILLYLTSDWFLAHLTRVWALQPAAGITIPRRRLGTYSLCHC